VFGCVVGSRSHVSTTLFTRVPKNLLV